MPYSNVVPVNISNEVKKSFLNYAMSVIISRAIPDVRDGLKPVQRRILYSMYEQGMTELQPHKKSARVIGDVIGRYHPHGDSTVYDALVRMAQPFTYLHPLINGQGNFGSIDGDKAAAMRYTEVKLTNIAAELLRDIHKGTVEFNKNYDNSELEPTVLPARFPNLLVNGATGIAVGMMTSIPPHNLAEIVDATCLLIDEGPDNVTINELLSLVKGPDFPTSGTIVGTDGIIKAYKTGNASITIRARCLIEGITNNKYRIVITELPYMVNKARLIEKIADQVMERKLEGISDLRDESDRNGIRIVLDLKKNVVPEILLNQLYKQTDLQTSLTVNMLVLVDGVPKQVNLKEAILYYINHQKYVTRERTKFELKHAEERLHLVEGYAIVANYLNEVITIIRESNDIEEANKNLMDRFQLTTTQANSILEMRLQQLTKLEIHKVNVELGKLREQIRHYLLILDDETKLNELIKQDLISMKKKYGVKRKTEIINLGYSVSDEDLIPNDQVCVFLTEKGYIKTMLTEEFPSQRRGGRGTKNIEVNDGDQLKYFFNAFNHDDLLVLTNKGKLYRKKVYQLPLHGKNSKGIPIINFFQMEQGEKVTALLTYNGSYEDNESLLCFVTKNGLMKRTPVSRFVKIRQNGIIAISLHEDDEAIGLCITNSNKEILVATQNGNCIRFHERDVRVMERTASGVKAIDVQGDDGVIGLGTIDSDDQEVVVVTEKGYGKRTSVFEYRTQIRGGKGILTFNVDKEKTGPLIGMKIIDPLPTNIILVSNVGTVISMEGTDIALMGRVTKGVQMMRIYEDERVTAIERIIKEGVSDIEAL